MKKYQNKQRIGQLEKRKGGYFYLKIDAGIVDLFENKRHTRFLCTIDRTLTFQCGLNHLGDGNFFIILSSKNVKAVGKHLGDMVSFELVEDPNPLGVDMPEVLLAVLEQYEDLKTTFESFTPGKKRNLVHSINKIKDIDKQIQKAIQMIKEGNRSKRPS